MPDTPASDSPDSEYTTRVKALIEEHKDTLDRLD